MDQYSRNIQKVAINELKPKEALEKAAEEWTQIVQKYGIDKQKVMYAEFVKTSKMMGYM